VAAINLRQRNWRLRPKNLYRLSRAVFQAKLLATARSNFCVAPIKPSRLDSENMANYLGWAI
jgi:hypothetical protein